jgi:hypothetical protein
VSDTRREVNDAHAIGHAFSVCNAPDYLAARWTQRLEWNGSSIEFRKAQDPGPGFPVAAQISGEAHEIPVMGNLSRILDESLFFAAHAPNQNQTLAQWKAAADWMAGYLASPRLRYVGPLRGAVLFDLEAKGTPVSAGHYGADTARLLSLITSKGTAAQRRQLDELAARFGLRGLSAGWAGAQALTVEYEDGPTAVRLPVSFAGFGSQQALPVIADLVHLEPGSTIMVEEIERSSHPEWIKEWGRSLAELVKSQVQIIATTHAPDLVLAVGLAVRRGIIAPDAVAIYEFRRDGGITTAERRLLDERGISETGWPATFAKAEQAIFGELLEGSDDKDGA